MHERVLLSHIAAASRNHVIGLKNKLPWHIPEDLRYFHKKTKNKILIMGRKTFESLGRPLPDRLNVILTKNANFKPDGAITLPSFEKALEYSRQKELLEKYDKEIFITGGGEIYKQTLLMMDRLYITRIHKDYKGDAFYPLIPENHFKEISRTDKKKPVPFSFLVYEKVYTD